MALECKVIEFWITSGISQGNLLCTSVYFFLYNEVNYTKTI